MDEIKWNLIKVLVVDDDETIIKMFESFMDKIGCVRAYARDGKQAVELLKVYNFDVCFMDVMMPVMGGVEAAQIIREEIDPKLPIIAITATAMKATRDVCLNVGMNDYIQKPLSFEIIKQKILEYGTRR